MVRIFIESILGEFGRQILYFYEANACLINAIVLTYGVVMFASWTNLVRIYCFMILEIAKSTHTSEDLNRKKTNKKIRDTVEIPWEKAIEKSPFPLIGNLGGLITKRKTVQKLKLYFDEKDLVDKAMDALKGQDIRRMSPSSTKIMRKELDNQETKAKK
ncbi:MAG: hypothetical protein ABFS17_07300 [Chloroflexota bacterium]